MDFEKNLDLFLQGAQKKSDEERMWTNEHNGMKFRAILKIKKGPKYYKIMDFDEWDGVEAKGGAVFGLINKDGDILKTSGGSTPAKHARGNIFDESHGVDGVSAYGVNHWLGLKKG